MLVTSIFSFSHNVFNPIKKKEIITIATFYFSSANALNLVKSKKLSFSKYLNDSFFPLEDKSCYIFPTEFLQR